MSDSVTLNSVIETANSSFQELLYSVQASAQYAQKTRKRGPNFQIHKLSDERSTIILEQNSQPNKTLHAVHVKYGKSCRKVELNTVVRDFENLFHDKNCDSAERVVIFYNNCMESVPILGSADDSIKLESDDGSNFINLESVSASELMFEGSTQCFNISQNIRTINFIKEEFEDYVKLAKELATVVVKKKLGGNFPLLEKYAPELKHFVIDEDLKSFRKDFTSGKNTELSMFRNEFEKACSTLISSAKTGSYQSSSKNLLSNFWKNIDSKRNLVFPESFLKNSSKHKATISPKLANSEIESFLKKLIIVTQFKPLAPERNKNTEQSKKDNKFQIMSMTKLKSDYVSLIQRIKTDMNFDDYFNDQSINLYLNYFKMRKNLFFLQNFGMKKFQFKTISSEIFDSERIVCVQNDEFSVNLVNIAVVCQAIESKDSAYIFIHNECSVETIEMALELFTNEALKITCVFDCNNPYDKSHQHLTKFIQKAFENEDKRLIFVADKEKISKSDTFDPEAQFHINYVTIEKKIIDNLAPESCESILQRFIKFQNNFTEMNKLVEISDIQNFSVADILHISCINVPDIFPIKVEQNLVTQKVLKNDIIYDSLNGNFTGTLVFKKSDYEEIEKTFPRRNIHFLKIDEKFLKVNPRDGRTSSEIILENLRDNVTYGLRLMWKRSNRDVTEIINYSKNKIVEYQQIIQKKKKLILIVDPNEFDHKIAYENLKYFAKQENPDIWFYKIDLHEFSTDEDLEDNLRKFLMNFCRSKNEFENLVVRKMLEYHKGIHLFITNFSFASHDVQRVLLDILHSEFINKFDRVYLVLTSWDKEAVEGDLKVKMLSYKIERKSRESQLNYVMKHWKIDECNERGKLLINGIFDKIYNSINSELLPGSLIEKMICECYQNQFTNVLHSTSDATIKLDTICIYDLFEKYFSMFTMTNPLETNILEELALIELDLEQMILYASERDSDSPQCVFDNKHVVCYLAAKYIWDNIGDQTILNELFNKIFISCKYQLLRLFFNAVIPDDFDSKDLNEIGTKIYEILDSKSSSLTFFSNLSFISTLTKESNLQIVKFITECLISVNKRDDFLDAVLNAPSLLLKNYLRCCEDDFKYFDWLCGKEIETEFSLFKLKQKSKIKVGDEIIKPCNLKTLLIPEISTKSLPRMLKFLRSKIPKNENFTSVLIDESDGKSIIQTMVENISSLSDLEGIFEYIRELKYSSDVLGTFLNSSKFSKIDLITFIYRKFYATTNIFDLSVKCSEIVKLLLTFDEELMLDLISEVTEQRNIIQTAIYYCENKNDYGALIVKMLQTLFKDSQNIQKAILIKGYESMNILHYLIQECTDKSQVIKNFKTILLFLSENCRTKSSDIKKLLLSQTIDEINVLQMLLLRFPADKEKSFKEIFTILKSSLKFSSKEIREVLIEKGYLNSNIPQTILYLSKNDVDQDKFLMDLWNFSKNDLDLNMKEIKGILLSQGMDNKNFIQSVIDRSETKSIDKVLIRILIFLTEKCQYSNEDVKEFIESKGYREMHLIQFALYKCNISIDPLEMLKKTIQLLSSRFRYTHKSLENLLLLKDVDNCNIFHTFVQKYWHKNGICTALIDVFWILEDLKIDQNFLSVLFLEKGPNDLNLLQFICNYNLKKKQVVEICKELLTFLAKRYSVTPELLENLILSKVYKDFTVVQLMIDEFCPENREFRVALRKSSEYFDENFNIEFTLFKKLLLSPSVNDLNVLQNFVNFYTKNDVYVNILIEILRNLNTKLNYDFKIINENFFMNENCNLFKVLMHDKLITTDKFVSSLKFLKDEYKIDVKTMHEILLQNCYFNRNLLQFLILEYKKKERIFKPIRKILEFLTTEYKYNASMIEELFISKGYNDMNLLHYIVFDCRSYNDRIEETFVNIFQFLREDFKFGKSNIKRLISSNCWNGMNFFHYLVSKLTSKSKLERALKCLFKALHKYYQFNEPMFDEILESTKSKDVTLYVHISKKGISESALEDIMDDILTEDSKTMFAQHIREKCEKIIKRKLSLF